MPRVDLPTVILYAGVMACIMGLILYFLGKSYPSHIRGVSLLATAPLIAGLATLARIGLRSIAPDNIAIGAQNVCLIGTAGFFLAGMCQFFGRPQPRRFLPLLLFVSIVAMVGFGSYAGGVVYRRLFARSLLIVLYAGLAWVVYRQPHTVARRLTLGIVIALVALLLLRTLSGYVFPAGDGVDSEALLQVIYAVGFSSTDVLIPIGVVLMISENLRSVFEKQAMHDSLTGLLTRRALFELGDNVLNGCRRSGTQLSVLMIDLDHFKEINDTYGHNVGDLVLQDFATRALGILRRPSLLARYGGEEFVAVLSSTSAQDAALIADRIRTEVQRYEGAARYKVSIGIASTDAQGSDSLALLIQQADRALYRAKQHGRDRIEMAI